MSTQKVRKGRERCAWRTRESGMKSPSNTIPRAADPKGDSRPGPRGGDGGLETESPGLSAGRDLEQRAHPSPAPCTRRWDPGASRRDGEPSRERRLPTSKHRARLPLQSPRRGQLLPLGRTAAAPPGLLSLQRESRAWARI